MVFSFLLVQVKSNKLTKKIKSLLIFMFLWFWQLIFLVKSRKHYFNPDRVPNPVGVRINNYTFVYFITMK